MRTGQSPGIADSKVISAIDGHYNPERCKYLKARRIPARGIKRESSITRFPTISSYILQQWMRFIEAELHQDHAWLSVALIYTQQPYSAPICFKIDAMIEMAESKAMKAEDELWLLQTDLDYSANLMKCHEREQFDL